MKSYSFKIFHAAFAAILLFTGPMIFASAGHNDVIPFEEANLFFELNNTDGDLGIHGKIDGDEWKRLKIKDPDKHTMLKIQVTGRLKRQGLTEIFFESAEPTFDELDPMEFFARFPQGIYQIEGVTLDGEKRKSEVYLSHVLPAAPDGVTVSGIFAADDCDAILPLVSPPVVIRWDDVTSNHPSLGISGDIEVDYYEVVVEQEDEEFIMSTILPADVTQITIPDDFIALGDEFKFEILVRATNGNKTALESCFEVD